MHKEIVLKLEALYEIGFNSFDSNEKALNEWLESRIPALGDCVPKDLLITLSGIDSVKNELLRIEHGIY
jgi:uncharacterized protein (DUF2384 family)